MTNTATAAPLDVPPGLTGKHRAAFLALDDNQKAIYLREWNVCGRPAALCHRVATTGTL